MLGPSVDVVSACIRVVRYINLRGADDTKQMESCVKDIRELTT